MISLVYGVEVKIEGTDRAGLSSLRRLATVREEEAKKTLQFLVDEWAPLLPNLAPLELAEVVYQLVSSDDHN